MAINIKTETLLTLNEAAEQLPRISHKKVHVSTLWRWCHLGLNDIHLDYLNIGHRIFTSDEALQRFFIALTENSHRRKKSSYRRNHRRSNTAARQRSIEEANAILVRAKIIQPAPREASHR